ncbi:MAG: GNAT family N-acetyltransferase [Micromonosporaceae bacterium]
MNVREVVVSGRRDTTTTPKTTTIPDVALAAQTSWGLFGLRTVTLPAHLELIHRWMHAEHVVPFWQQDWPVEKLSDYLAGQLAGDTSRPCLGSLAGVPVSYWEIYRAAHDPVGGVYDARPHDLGIHLLIGERGLTGRGLGSMLIAAVADGLFELDPACERVVAEPDVRNPASIRAFGRAGFAHRGDVVLPGKTAALMVRERDAEATR